MSSERTSILPGGGHGPDRLSARAASRTRGIQGWDGTTLQQKWRSRVVEGNPDDFIIAISASSKTGVSGSGKTTLATQLAKACAVNESGFDADKYATLDAGKLAYEIIPESEYQAPIIYDEAQGAPGTDSVNKRKGMTNEAIDAINSILAARDEGHTLIIVIQQLSMLDKSLLPMLDAWLLIRYAPSYPRGPLAVHYSPSVNDHDLKNPDIYTDGVERISWEPLPKSDPDYQTMEELKQEAKRRKKEQLNEQQQSGLSRNEQMELAQDLRNHGMTLKEIAKLDSIEYSYSVISKNTERPNSEKAA